jgi:Spy/CpxP family protein refolding chaperone
MMGMRGNPCEMLKIHAKEIGLTEEQLKKIDQMCSKTEKSMIDLRAKVDTLRVDMRTEMDKDKPDRATVLKLQEDINKLHGDLGKLRLTQMLDIKDLMTPEQAAKCKELRTKRLLEMRERGFGGGDKPEMDDPEPEPVPEPEEF